MSDKPAILVVQPHLAAIASMLEADFTVWRLWQAPPLEASATIRAIVVAGEFPIDRMLAERLPNLGLIACFTAGYDGVDLAWASERGLKVSHSPGINHEDVADQAIGLMLAAWRGLLEGDAIVREGRWRPTEKRITRSLAGHRLGIVGLAASGEPAGAGRGKRHPGRRRPRRRGEREADRPAGHRGARRPRPPGQRRA